MKDRNFIILVCLVLLTSISSLGLQLDAKRQRAQSRRERREIICILKIEPKDRVAKPLEVTKCEEGL